MVSELSAPGNAAAQSEERAPCYLIHDASFDPLEFGEALYATPVPVAEREQVPAEARVLLYLGDEQIRDLALLALERRWEVGLLAHPEATSANAALGVRGKPAELMAHYQDVDPIETDVLTCNGELVFSSVVIGRVLSLRPYDINRPQTRWSFFSGAMKGLGKLRLRQYKVTTAKERQIQLAAIGLIALNHTQSALLGRNFTEDLGIADGRVSLVALAPRSVLSYLMFMFRLLLPGKVRLSRLPESVALIQSGHLAVEAPRGCEYLVDGKPVHGKEIEFHILEERLRLLPGPALAPRLERPAATEKETVRLNHIPVDEAAREMTDKHLPVFSHATEEEYRELFVSLRDSASVTSSYQVLMVLSVLLALAGMYANSAPVIIGAMILAPLMSPVVSLAMGLARTEAVLIRSSLRTLLVGVGWGLGCAVMLAWAMPLDIPTPEMRARMSPNLLDLLVAIISGVAGAYAHAKEEIAKSLAGVAIAVALVPPLSVAGIGLGWGDWDMAWGAFLLLTTNLVGIALAASMTFLALGFAPFHRARTGIGVTLVIMLVISAPLSLAFYHLVETSRIVERVPLGDFQLGEELVHVSQVRVSLGEPHLVRVTLSSSRQLDEQHVDQLKALVSERLGEPVRLEAQLNIRR